jgi:cytochrome P450
LVDGLVASGPPSDLAAGLAWPLGITVICETLGVPAVDHDRFRTWTDQIVALTADDPSVIVAARDNLDSYLGELIAMRRDEPVDDLLSDLIVARDEQDRLSEPELVASVVTLLVAGHETTANQLGNFVYTLLSRRERWESLVADPGSVPTAVEELLRYTPLESAVGFFARVATQDVDLGDRTVAAGEAVVVALSSANRDGAVFADPDRLDLARTVNPHVAFGHGVHHCIGAPLARMELQVAIGTLVRRLPGLRLATPAADVEWITDRMMTGPRALPVSW